MFRYIALMLVSSVVTAGPLEMVESDVYETHGSQSEILTRGRACIAQLVRFDAIGITGAADGSLTAAISADPFSPDRVSQQVPGGAVIVTTTPDSVVANNRVDFKAYLSRQSAQSTLTLLAKDGRFKLRHTAIRSLSLDSGMLANAGYTTIAENAPFAKRVRAALESISAKVAECVKAKPSEQW